MSIGKVAKYGAICLGSVLLSDIIVETSPILRNWRNRTTECVLDMQDKIKERLKEERERKTAREGVR